MEHHLQTFAGLILQFTQAYQSQFEPLLPSLSQPQHQRAGTTLPLSPLGSQFAELLASKDVLDKMLHACQAIKTNYESMMTKEIHRQLDNLTHSKPDVDVIAKLSEVRKIFDSSLARLEEESKHREQRAKEMIELVTKGQGVGREKRIGMQMTQPSFPPSVTSDRRDPYSQTVSQSQSRSLSSPNRQFSSSILTSSIDLTYSHEQVGSGSAGMFSPVKSTPLPSKLVTRTGAIDYDAIQQQREDEEIARQQQLNIEHQRELAMTTRLSSSRSQSPSSYSSSRYETAS